MNDSQQLRTNGARYTEAALLMAEGRFHEADSVVEAMPNEQELMLAELNERGRMLKYIEVLAGASNNGRDEYQLSLQELDSLEHMIGTHYDRPSVWASNLLCAVYGRCRAPYTGPVPTPKSLKVRDLTQPNENDAYSRLGIEPNPARDEVTFTYEHVATDDSRAIVIRDLTGSILTTIPANDHGRTVWNASALNSGVYLVEYQVNGSVKQSERMIIQR